MAIRSIVDERVEPEICSNCASEIEPNDAPYVWDDAIVCGNCHAALSGSEGQPNSSGSAEPDRFNCDNCGRLIGKLEQPYNWGGNVVCPQCLKLLQTGGVESVTDAELIEDDITGLPEASGTQCPNCRSADTASYRMIHEHGSTSWSGSSIGLAGNEMIVAGSSGSSMSRAAVRTAPPRRRENSALVIGFLLLVGIILFCISFGLKNASTDPYHQNGAYVAFAAVVGVLSLIFAVVSLFSIIANLRWNANEMPRRYSAWSRRWMCRRCGTSFIP